MHCLLIPHNNCCCETDARSSVGKHKEGHVVECVYSKDEVASRLCGFLAEKEISLAKFNVTHGRHLQDC